MSASSPWQKSGRLNAGGLDFRHFCENSQVVETLIWWGRRFRLPTLTNGRLPKETTAFPSQRCTAVPDLAAVGNSAGQWKCRRIPNSRTRFRGRRSWPGSSCIGPPLAPGPADCRSGLRYHFDRRLRKAFLSSLRLGSNAEPRAFADEMAERIDCQKRKPNPGTNRAAVLAGREF